MLPELRYQATEMMKHLRDLEDNERQLRVAIDTRADYAALLRQQSALKANIRVRAETLARAVLAEVKP